MIRPRIADVQCTRLQFQPGDRILVRAYCQFGDGRVIQRVANTQCTNMQLRPGDKVLVDVFYRLSVPELKDLYAEIERWAGQGIEVSVTNRPSLERPKRLISQDERQRLTKSIERWSGNITSVLVYDATQMEIQVDRSQLDTR